VDVVVAEILHAVRRLVLRVLVLTKAGIEKEPLPLTPVKAEPSPTNFPKTVPAEIVEKNP